MSYNVSRDSSTRYPPIEQGPTKTPLGSVETEAIRTTVPSGRNTDHTIILVGQRPRNLVYPIATGAVSSSYGTHAARAKNV